MTDLDRSELTALLDDVRRELADAVDELDRTHAAHRRVESLLLVLLDHLPVATVVVDEELRVRAASAAAELSWGATIDGLVSGLDALDGPGVVGALRAALEAGHLPAGALPSGFGGALVTEPGTGIRYIAVWAG